MKTIKRIFSFLLVMIMLIGVFPDLHITANAEKVFYVHGSQFTSGTLSTRLEEILYNGMPKCDWLNNSFPAVYTSDGKNNSFDKKTAYTITADAAHGGTNTGWQCYAYAKAAFYYMFHYLPNSNKNTAGKIKDLPGVQGKQGDEVSYANFQKWGVRFGAYVRTTANSNGSYNGNNGHSFIILGYDAKSVTYLEGNGDGKGGIDVWSGSWKDFRTRLHMEQSGKNAYRRLCQIVQPVDSIYNELTCKHSWNSLGVCDNCKEVYNYQSSWKYADGTIEPNNCIFAVEIKETPYSASGNIYSTRTKSIQVTGKVVNQKGETWFEVKTPDSGTKGYVYCTNTENKIFRTYYSEGPGGIREGNAISVPPASVTQGKGVTMKGTIVSSKYNITTVTVGVYNSNGTVATYKDGTATKQLLYTANNVNSLTFDLSKSDSAIAIRKLPAGSYTFKIEATADTSSYSGSSSQREYVAQANHFIKTADFKVSGGTVKLSNYTVNFNSNGGNLSQQSKTVAAGSSINLSSVSIPRRTAYTFLGWAGSANATSAEYTSSDSYKPNASTTLYAVWKEIAKPGTPSFTQKTLDIATGGNATLSWWASTGAEKYVVTVYNGNSSEYLSRETTGLSTASTMPDEGTYTVRVKATNVAGQSAESQAVTIQVHGPSTVSFLDHDGSILSRQSVAYGASALTPSSPTREGYTFSGWDNTYTNVTTDRTVRAKYSAIGYTVSFYDYVGNVVSTQTVTYNGNTPGSATAPNASTLGIPSGYVFTGWDTDEWKNVKRSGIQVHPSCVWDNTDVPITTTIGKITPATGNGSTTPIGYWVNYSLVNHVNSYKTGRFVVVLKDSNGKFLTKTESGAFYIAANGTYSGSIYVPVEATNQEEAYAEFYVVDSYNTLVPISEVQAKYLAENTITFWSGWMTESEYKEYIKTVQVVATENKTQYRYRDLSISDWTTATSMSGWSRYDSRTVKSDWSAWSAWQDAAVTANDNRNVQTQQVKTADAYTQYRYGRYYSTNCSKGTWLHFDGNTGKSQYGGTWNLEYTSWSTSRTSPTNTNYYYSSHNNAVGTGRKDGNRYYWDRYQITGYSHGKTWYWEESQVIPATYKTQYRYQTRSDVTEYRYSQWGAWNEWSDSSVTTSATRDVETRVLYRVQVSQVVETSVAQPTGGETISGRIDGLNNPGGKLAILNIYKVDEASDYSNEYIAMTELAADGSYSFSGIHTYEEPSVKTGDFTVTLTIEGSTGPMVLETGKFKAPKAQYTVEFVDEITGEQIGEKQIVEEGSSAVAPVPPEKEGYIFLGWEYGLTNIRDDMVIHARYAKKTYVVVFVDWLKGTVTMVEDIPYGQTIYSYSKDSEPGDDGLYILDPDESEGYAFLGWQTDSGEAASTVTRNMVVSAVYEKLSYTVTFLDPDGNVIYTQNVEYGDIAEFPDDDEVEINWTSDNMYISSWNSEEIEFVTHDMIVSPILMYGEDADVAQVNMEPGIYVGTQQLIITPPDEETTVMYSIISESVSSEESDNVYEGPIELTDSAVVEITTSREGANNTVEVYEYIIVPEETRPEDPTNLTAEAGTTSVMLRWTGVEGADGYIVSKTDEFGTESTFMTSATSFEDINVRALVTYSYFVRAYSLYKDGDSETLLLSDGISDIITVKFYGNQFAVEEIVVSGPDRVALGNVVPFSVTVYPDTAYNQSVTWGVESVTGDGTITQDGFLSATSAGIIKVYAQANDGSDVIGSREVIIYESQEDFTAIRVDSKTAVTGGQVSINISIDEASYASMLQFSVQYDSDVLQLTSADPGSLMAELAPTINASENGVVRFAWEANEGLVNGGTLLTLSFKVLGSEQESSYIFIPTESDGDMEFVCAKIGTDGITAEELNCTVYNGCVEVIGVLYGDVNGDGKVNVIDANMARRYAAKLIDLNAAQFMAADVNGDGKVNVMDANIIRRYVAKLIDTFPVAQ